jgi:hypothetical protein
MSNNSERERIWREADERIDEHIRRTAPDLYAIHEEAMRRFRQKEGRASRGGERFRGKTEEPFREQPSTGPIKAEVLDADNNVIARTRARVVRTQRRPQGE